MIILLIYFALVPFVYFTDNGNGTLELFRLMFSGLTVFALTVQYVIQSGRKLNFNFKWNKSLSLLSLWFAANLVSLIFSADTFNSLWGDSFLPSDSVWSIFVFLFLAYFSVQFVDTEKRVMRLIYVVLGGVILSAAYGTAQSFGFDPLDIRSGSGNEGVAGLLGFGVCFAIYLGAALPMLLILYFRAHRPIQRGLVLGGITVVVLGIAVAGARTPALLTLAVIIIAVSYFLRRQVKSAVILVVVIIGVIGVTLLSTNGIINGERFSRAKIEKSIAARALTWQAGLAGFKENPIVGSGPETFFISARKYQPVEMNKYELWDFFRAKANSQIVQYLSTVGLLGTIAFLILFCLLIWDTVVILLRPPLNNMGFTALGLSFGFIYINLAAMTSSNFIITQMLSYIFAALFYSAKNLSEARTSGDEIAWRIKYPILGVLIAAVLFTTYAGTARWLAEIHFHRSQLWQAERETLTAIDEINLSIALTPENGIYHCHKANLLGLMLHKNKNKVDETSRNDVTKKIDELSTLCVESGPSNYIYYAMRGELFFHLYDEKLIRDFSRSERAYKKLIELTPTNPRAYYSLGNLYAKTKNDKEFLVEMNKAVSLKEDYSDAYFQLFKYYYSVKDMTSLDATLAKLSTVKSERKDFSEELKNLKKIIDDNGDKVRGEVMSRIIAASGK